MENATPPGDISGEFFYTYLEQGVSSLFLKLLLVLIYTCIIYIADIVNIVKAEITRAVKIFIKSLLPQKYIVCKVLFIVCSLVTYIELASS